MQAANKPANEHARLELLKELKILDTALEENFDEITRLVGEICEVPISLISLVDENRQWFKSKYGLDADETPRELAFCAHAILEPEIFEIPDSRLDPRFHDNPLVTGAPNVIFYAGYPLEVEEGLRIGTLCAIDNQPRKLNSLQKSALKTLGHQVVMQMRLRKVLDALTKSEQQAHQASIAKSNFLANMNHEIRTPINAVIGYAEMVLEEKIDAKIKEPLEIIHDSATSLLDIVNDVLYISQIEARKLSLHPENFDLSELLSSLVKMIEPRVQENVKLDFVDRLASPLVYSDKGKIRQIISNLLSNAVKFTMQGEITLTCQPLKENGNRIEFVVEDTGPGIEAKVLAKFFQRFVRTESPLSSKESTGLGLAISKGLVEVMGGELKVESKQGKGTRFSFSVEMKNLIDQALNVVEPSVRALEQKICHLKVLVVEDNPVNRDLLVRRLEKLKVKHIDVAQDGEAAFALASEQTYDIIFMDVRMPHMDGIEATQKLREDGIGSFIIGLTGGTTSEEKQACFDAGMDQFLSKPAKGEKIKEEILNYLDKL